MYRVSEFTKDFYKVGEVARIVGMSPHSMQGWDTRGVLEFDRTVTNRRVLPRDRLLEFLDSRNLLIHDDDRRDVVYACVSDSDDNTVLDAQVMRVIEAAGDKLVRPLIVKEHGDAFDDARPKLLELITMVMGNTVGNVYVEDVSILATCGIKYILTAFAAHDTHVVDMTHLSGDERSV